MRRIASSESSSELTPNPFSHTPILSQSQKSRMRTLEGLEGLEAFFIVKLWEPSPTRRRCRLRQRLEGLEAPLREFHSHIHFQFISRESNDLRGFCP